MDYLWIIVMFLSAVWTLILTAPIHCRASTGEQLIECYISPNLMKKLIYILDGLRVSTSSAHFHFCMNYSFKLQNYEFYLLIRAENVQIKSADSILVTEDPSDMVSYSYLKHA